MIVQTKESTDQTAIPLLAFDRPNFPSVVSFLASYEAALAARRRPWPARTRGEVIALVKRHPGSALRHIPQPPELELMGLPPDFGRPIPALDHRTKLQIIEALRTDMKFSRAFREALKHG